MDSVKRITESFTAKAVDGLAFAVWDELESIEEIFEECNEELEKREWQPVIMNSRQRP